MNRTDEQDLSKVLFGQLHRLSVMAAVANSDAPVNPTDLAAELGLAQSAIQAPLRDLVAAGLVTRTIDGRRNVYTRVPSKVWPWIVELHATATKSSRGRTGG